MIITSTVIMKQFIVFDSDDISFDASHSSTSKHLECIKKLSLKKTLLEADFLKSKLLKHVK